MAEQVFRSPGYFEREIELSISEEAPFGTPYGIIGTSQRGPAFVATTVGGFPDFQGKFGTLEVGKFAPYAVRFTSENKNNITFMRVLGAGAVSSSSDSDFVRTTGQVVNAGFSIVPQTMSTQPKHESSVQFLVGRHVVQTNEAYGLPMFTDNDSYSINGSGQYAYLLRGVLFAASGSRIMVLSSTGSFSDSAKDSASVSTEGKFKIVISSSAGNSFRNTDTNPGVLILTASFNPSDKDYIANVLNTDPHKFGTEKHYLYAHFPVDDGVATLHTASTTGSVAVLSGTTNTSPSSGDTTMSFINAFGRFNTRYTTPRTPSVISQPFGGKEYDLFYIEAIDDGAFANNKWKISISDLRASTDPTDIYGTFAVVVREFSDLDTDPVVLEQFPICSLNPDSNYYIAKIIGDKKVSFNFDGATENERRQIEAGTYPNKSKLIRVVVNQQVIDKTIPEQSLPFGFRGVSVLKTNDDLKDYISTGTNRINGTFASALPEELALSSSIVPPLPFRFKVTRGTLETSGFSGNPGPTEVVDNRFHWGVKFERNTTVLNPNVNGQINQIVENYAKFGGLEKLDVLVTGSSVDTFNSNKFSLSKVALYNTAVADLTGTTSDHMRQAAYLRNASVDPSTYTVSDGTITNRLTFGSLLKNGATTFNKFSDYAKFTTFFYGGFDGVNILDKDSSRMNDKSTSLELGGGATTTYIPSGFTTQQNGAGQANQNIVAYQVAAKILTDPVKSNINIISIPGIREPLVTDYVLNRTTDYGLAMYVFDIPEYTDTGTRIFDSDTTSKITSVETTIEEFESRAIDNKNGVVYFPDIIVEDDVNGIRTKNPASVAALSALAYNDKVAFPWYAPAGFNRGALPFVRNVSVKLTQDDRNNLEDARINPIAVFPRQGYVIFGQRNLQQDISALNRVNVRRMLLELKKAVTDVSRRIIFDQNTPAIRARFIKELTPILTTIQIRQGISGFNIVCDDTNNSINDVRSKRLNGKIVVVAIRSIEHIALDFIVDPRTGVSFGT